MTADQSLKVPFTLNKGFSHASHEVEVASNFSKVFTCILQHKHIFPRLRTLYAAGELYVSREVQKNKFLYLCEGGGTGRRLQSAHSKLRDAF